MRVHIDYRKCESNGVPSLWHWGWWFDDRCGLRSCVGGSLTGAG